MATKTKTKSKTNKKSTAKKEYDNSNRGVLFQNEDKQSDNSPDHRGNVKFVVDVDDVIDNEDGTVTIHRYISAWDQTSEKCGDYLSLAVGKAVPETHGEEDSD